MLERKVNSVYSLSSEFRSDRPGKKAAGKIQITRGTLRNDRALDSSSRNRIGSMSLHTGSCFRNSKIACEIERLIFSGSATRKKSPLKNKWNALEKCSRMSVSAIPPKSDENSYDPRSPIHFDKHELCELRRRPPAQRSVQPPPPPQRSHTSV